MNIIEVIKTGKDFKRKSWKGWDKYTELYLFFDGCCYRNRSNYKPAYFGREDILADDWEVKEPEQIKHEENKMTFDPTKPVQTRNGKKARILCANLLGGKKFPVVAAIKYDDEEFIHYYDSSGRYDVLSNIDQGHDLINIPEEITFDPKKPVQTRNGCKAQIIYTNLKGDYPIVALVEDKDGCEEIETFTINGIFDANGCPAGDNEKCAHDLINIPEKKR